MIYNFFALLVFSAALFTQVLTVPCNCGLGRGVDVCSGQDEADINGNGKYPLVVRPQTLPKIDIKEMVKPGSVTYEKIISGESNIAPLTPIGDVCSCGRTIITPAYVPKPACSGCGGGSGSSSISLLEQAATSSFEQALQRTSSSSSQSQSSVNSENVGGLIVDLPVCGLPVVQNSRPVYYGSQAPADAVSKTLAYQQLQNKQNALDHEIQYGFKTIPREEFQQINKEPAFHEDNIYRHNGDILELGKIYQTPSVDETAIAELEEEEEPEFEPEPVNVQEITLGSLGFVPTYGPKTRFTNVVPQPHITEYETSSCGIDSVPKCNDGFRGGQVIIQDARVQSENAVPQKTVLGYVSEDDGSRYVNDAVYSYSANPRRAVVDSFGSSSTSSSSRSSSSSNTNSFNSFFRRGSCV